jgi:hypothetical protein
MVGDLADGVPPIPGIGTAVWSRHESTIVTESRGQPCGTGQNLALLLRAARPPSSSLTCSSTEWLACSSQATPRPQPIRTPMDRWEAEALNETPNPIMGVRFILAPGKGKAELHPMNDQLEMRYRSFHTSARLPKGLSRRASAPLLVYPHERWASSSGSLPATTSLEKCRNVSNLCC